MKDVIIIGAGVCGCAIADALGEYDCDIAVIERASDVACGASKANSGIVHGGFDAPVGSLKAKFNALGNPMFDTLAEQLDFPFRRNGAYVLAFDTDGISGLNALLERGIANGISGLKIVSGDDVRKLNPNVSAAVTAALYSPSSGIVSPYEMTIAFAERAYMRGARFIFDTCVTSVTRYGDYMRVTCSDNSCYEARLVINCAGVHADEIAAMAGAGDFRIKGRRGEYYLLDKTQSYLTDATLFQLPTALGKGVLVAPTVHGNVLVGPTALDTDNKDDVSATALGLAEAADKGRLSVPSISLKSAITQFVGVRAHSDRDDFIIGMSSVEGFYNVAGIESPGLTSAPAIAVHVAKEAAQYLGASRKQDLVVIRKGIPCFAAMSDDERAKLIASDSRYGKIVCRCECVTEGEIIDSIKRPLGARDLDGVKRRTRAGMGRCQAGFCSPEVIRLIADTLGAPITEVTKCGAGSYVVAGRI